MVFQVCEDFSIEEKSKYISRFKARAINLLSAVSHGLEISDLLENSKSAFSQEEQDKLYKHINYPTTRHLLSRALCILEGQGQAYFEKTRWVYGRKPEQSIKTSSSH